LERALAHDPAAAAAAATHCQMDMVVTPIHGFGKG
jgi:hypothetical protein